MTDKLNIWDSKALSDTYMTLAQIRAQIEGIIEQVGVANLYSLPNSMVPTVTLYEISICYSILYNRLLDADLLKIGAVKQSHSKETH